MGTAGRPKNTDGKGLVATASDEADDANPRDETKAEVKVHEY